MDQGNFQLYMKRGECVKKCSYCVEEKTNMEASVHQDMGEKEKEE